jgi:hypothetical protein
MVGASTQMRRGRPISARHGEHLLLAAREDAAAPIYALGDTREERRHPLKICRDHFPVGWDRRPSANFRTRSSAGRCAAPLKPSRPQGYHLTSGPPVDAFASERDRSRARRDKAEDDFHCRRFAGGVAAQQRDDAALSEFELEIESACTSP